MIRQKFGISDEDLTQLEAGDLDVLIEVLTHFAKHWVKINGFPVQAWSSASFSNVAANNANGSRKITSEQRAFLAAGCNLFGALSLTLKVGKPLVISLTIHSRKRLKVNERYF